jgi:hypothetical protein
MRHPHIRLLLAHALGGAVVGLVTAALLVWLDIARLWTLANQGADGWIGLGLLGFGFAVTFGSAALGAAIMAETGTTPRPPRGRGRLVLAPIAVAAKRGPGRPAR